ncbi:MAG: hypothetical protein M3P45_10665 [Acidobacteriota bacterium]|nr:hypothetical protein [Acidobacteriota bacterium]
MDGYLTTYTADNSDTFWTCALEGCTVPFLHEVGYTRNHEWKHIREITMTVGSDVLDDLVGVCGTDVDKILDGGFKIKVLGH